jgi:hypothetical protein
VKGTLPRTIPAMFGLIWFSGADLYRLYKLDILIKDITFKSSPLKPLNQIKASLAGMVFLSHNIPKRNKLAEKISQKNPKYMLNYSLPCCCG